MTMDKPWAVKWSGRGSQYTEEEIDYIVEAIRTADPLTQGRYLADFEEKFKEFTGASHAFAVANCTCALELAAILCRLTSDDEVIVPAHTFAATAIPFARTGAKIVWADIDPRTLVVDAGAIQKCLSARTRAIVVVHLYGLVCDMDPILSLAREHGIPVIEDAAQALGATYKGTQAGTMGDFGCYSFQTHKNVSTLGEGGVLSVRSPDLAALVPGLRHNGMRAYEGDRPNYWLPAMGDVDFDWDGVWPYNFCIGEPQCAAGVLMLDRVDEVNAHRREKAERFERDLGEYPELVFQATPQYGESARYCLPARYDGTNTKGSRNDFMDRMAHHHRVNMVVQYHPLYRYPMFEKAGFGDADCPHTDFFFDNMVSFPFHEWMPANEYEYLVSAAQETCEHLRH